MKHIEGDNLIATGDDDGCIKIWDLRKAKSVCKLNEHAGTVMDLAVHNGMLLSVANDGYLGVWDIGKRDLYAMSDCFEEDLS